MTKGRGRLMKANQARIKREAIRQNLLFTSRLLIDASTFQRYWADKCRSNPKEEALRELSRCRHILEALVRDYIRLVAQYRVAVKSSISRTTAGRI